jgi:hypothetical protein
MPEIAPPYHLGFFEVSQALHNCGLEADSKSVLTLYAFDWLLHCILVVVFKLVL